MSVRGIPADSGDEEKPDKGSRGDYTLTHAKPETVKAVALLLARGIPKKQLCKSFGLHFYTVDEIEKQCYPEIEQQRKRAAERIYSGLTSSIDSACVRGEKGLATAMDVKMLADAWRDLVGIAPPQTHIHTFAPLTQWESLGDGGKVIEQEAD